MLTEFLGIDRYGPWNYSPIIPHPGNSLCALQLYPGVSTPHLLMQLACQLNAPFGYHSLRLSHIIYAIFLLSCSTAAISFLALRRRLERIKSEKSAIEHTNQHNERFLYIIGHDLMGPMSSIAALLHLLKEKKLSKDEHQEIVDMLFDAQQQTIETLDKLLKWASIRQNGISSNFGWHLSQPVLEIALRQCAIQAAQKNIEITDISKRNLSVQVDPDHLEFIFRNVIGNAIKFTPTGGKVTIGNLLSENPGQTVYFVSDTGIGIDQPTLTKLATGETVTSSGTELEKGTGLGLKLSKAFIEQNNGKIEIISESGKGTVVYIYLNEQKPEQYSPS